MDKLYVGHEVVLRKKFNNHAFVHDLVGCNLKNSYYVSRKVVLLNRHADGTYNYYDTCVVASWCPIDPNDFISCYDVLSCNDCHLAEINSADCELVPSYDDRFIGVVDIQPLSSFTNTKPEDKDLAILLVKEYNESIENDTEYVHVNDDNYVKVIRSIDDGFSKSKTKQQN